MKNVLKNEISRSFFNKMFFISMAISSVLVVWYSIERIPFCIESNNLFANELYADGFFETSFTNWIGSHKLYLQQDILYVIIPILAVLPFGSSLYNDINQGYVKGIFTRTSKNKYLISKYIAVFLSGGCAVVIPMILSFLISSCFLPTMLPEASYLFTNIDSVCKWSDLLFVNPFLYYSLYIIMTFFFSGALACMALFITYFSSKNFLVLVFPFFIYIFSSMLFELMGLDDFSLRNILVTNSEYGTTFSVAVLAISLLVLSFVPYYFYGVRYDVS